MSKKLSKLLVTGGAGFIGSEFVRQGVQKGDRIIVVDKLTYAGDIARLAAVKNKITFHKADISNTSKIETIIKKEKPDFIIHFAAETHVDRSILDVNPFLKTNIIGTQNLIKTALKYKIKKFIHISTDEVYGEIKKGQFNENSLLTPGNPYSASKAAADLLIKAAIRTFHLPAIIVRPSNNYGPWQYPEKLIPVIILKALNDQKIPVYGDGQNVREWLYVADCAEGIFHILKKGKIGEVYNISSYEERKNLQTVKNILRLLKKSESLINFVRDRPGHDFRYSLNCNKLRKLGWKPKTKFTPGITKTVSWNKENIKWVESKLNFLQSYWRKVYKKKK